MKYFKLFILFIITVSCSNDSNNSELGTGDGIGGSLAIFALKGDYLYAVDNQKLNVFSLINAVEPSKVNQINVGFNIETLFSKGDYLFIGSRNGMFIYSIQNPENPVQLSNVQHFTSCDPVVANDTHSFVTLHNNTSCGGDVNILQIYDSTDLTNPILIHQRNLTYPRGLGLYGKFLVVCDIDIKIFNIENPNEPVMVKSINKNCFDVIIKGNDLYAIGDAAVYRFLLHKNQITNVVLQSEILF
jgi:hypothetical protein